MFINILEYIRTRWLCLAEREMIPGINISIKVRKANRLKGLQLSIKLIKMELTKFTRRELRTLLKGTTEPKDIKMIEAELKARELKFNSGVKNPTIIQVVGIVSRTSNGDANMLVEVSTKKGVYKTELSPKQLDTAKGDIRVGTPVSVQVEQRIKGVTQYLDDAGKIQFHGTKRTDVPEGTMYEKAGLLTVVSREYIEMYKLIMD